MYKVLAIICIVCSAIAMVIGLIQKDTFARIIWALCLGIWIYNLTQSK